MSNLSLKLEQKAKILQVQRLTIQMLALHAQDLADFLQEQVTDNPLLDIRYHDVRPAAIRAIRPSTISAAAVIPWKPGSWPSSASSPCPGRS